MKRFITTICLGAIAMLTTEALAQTDTTFTYQGSLTDGGTPATGTYTVDFALFNALVGGAQVGSTISIPAQLVTDGVFTSELDFGELDFAGTLLWLEIAVDNNVLSPRQPVSASPFSVQTRGLFVDAFKNVGIGTTTPAYPLDVTSDDPIATMVVSNTSLLGTGDGIWGTVVNPFGTGLVGYASDLTGTNFGTRGESPSTRGIGVFGLVSATVGTTIGTKGESHSPSGIGVHGLATSGTGFALGMRGTSMSTTGRGVFGEALSGTGTAIGVVGQTASADGWGVSGFASAGSGFTVGVYGRTNSPTGTGVVGRAFLDSGVNTGVHGFTDSPDGTGVRGQHRAIIGTTPGVLGESNSTSGNAAGVHGRINTTSPGPSSAGVHGENRSTTGLGIGVLGSHEGAGWGVHGTSPDGRGVFGWTSDLTGPGVGVYGRSESSSGTGVVGVHQATTGTAPGVLGETNSTSSSAIGVHGRINSTSPGGYSTAVRGENLGTGANGIGVYGTHAGNGWGMHSTSVGGRAVYAVATATTGVNYAVFGQSNSTSGYDFYAGGSGINYGASSSIRWKHNVTNIDNPLDKLAALRGVYFDWDEEHGGAHDVGMIAEEVGKILPEIVNYEANGYDAIGMDYSKLTPLLVEAVNALRAENDELRSEKDTEILTLNTRIEKLEQLVSRLTANE